MAARQDHAYGRIAHTGRRPPQWRAIRGPSGRPGNTAAFGCPHCERSSTLTSGSSQCDRIRIDQLRRETERDVVLVRNSSAAEELSLKLEHSGLRLEADPSWASDAHRAQRVVDQRSRLLPRRAEQGG
eukprot:scaffold9048_cov31-Tisochrysis_lutea.AAC.2